MDLKEDLHNVPSPPIKSRIHFLFKTVKFTFIALNSNEYSFLWQIRWEIILDIDYEVYSVSICWFNILTEWTDFTTLTLYWFIPYFINWTKWLHSYWSPVHSFVDTTNHTNEEVKSNPSFDRIPVLPGEKIRGTFASVSVVSWISVMCAIQSLAGIQGHTNWPNKNVCLTHSGSDCSNFRAPGPCHQQCSPKDIPPLLQYSLSGSESSKA